jgi:hypothetical protein
MLSSAASPNQVIKFKVFISLSIFKFLKKACLPPGKIPME